MFENQGKLTSLACIHEGGGARASGHPLPQSSHCTGRAPFRPLLFCFANILPLPHKCPVILSCISYYFLTIRSQSLRSPVLRCYLNTCRCPQWRLVILRLWPTLGIPSRPVAGENFGGRSGLFWVRLFSYGQNNKTMATVLFSFWKYKSREFCMIQKHLMKGADYILLCLCILSIIMGKLSFLTQKQHGNSLRLISVIVLFPET